VSSPRLVDRVTSGQDFLGASVFPYRIPWERSAHLFPLSFVVSVHNLPWPDDARTGQSQF